ncbi:MAG: urea carboxylase-associated family protein [Thiomicrorhabdus chilensis]|uniref:urea amidolyase associated protein UAAP1 n=1 Tax=Thiomicrorhabdus chilensis TaxID=63656 RepID=UPI00299E00CD|nr:urea amidolyase associated protein UAAP1 [Thiomicrorhabdus chilensis]MDX1347669.1 urea carboxylase-associated family protein [Thiomicrorhabdus chilensis]
MSDQKPIIWSEQLPGGAHWSGVMRRGSILRVKDLDGGANVSMLMFNLEVPSERYNMPDTLKGQKTAFLTQPNVCYSDMGRVMCSIVDDTCGWHDTIGGISDADMVKAKYGEADYQQAHNDYHKNGYDSLINELEKWGLDAKDLVPNVNLFSKIRVELDGDMTYVADNSQAGDYVDLRFEMDCIVVLATAQHPLDDSTEYAPQPIELTAMKAEPVQSDDACLRHKPENERAFYNTAIYYGEKPYDFSN